MNMNNSEEYYVLVYSPKQEKHDFSLLKFGIDSYILTKGLHVML